MRRVQPIFSEINLRSATNPITIDDSIELIYFKKGVFILISYNAVTFDESFKYIIPEAVHFDENLKRKTAKNAVSFFSDYERMNIFDNQWNNPVPFVPPNFNGLYEIANLNALYGSEVLCKIGVDWKESVQCVDINLLRTIVDLQDSIIDGSYEQIPPNEFSLNERGKTRLIKSNSFKDRIVQKSLNNNILIPLIENKLIYDNSASRIGKGLSHARSRFKYALINAYRRWGYEAYILTIDFSKYFDNIVHSTLLQQLSEILIPEYLNFVEQRLREYEIDVSYMDDEEYSNCMNTVFNSLEYNNIDKKLKTGEKFMAKSMGIGNQTSQFSGLFYPHEIDNYCKIVLGIKEYGRYMDDTYIILENKEELLNLLNNYISPTCKRLGIHINERKTRILKINNPISYLKLNYLIQPSGKVIVKAHSETFNRERRRLRKFHKLYLSGKIPLVNIVNYYKCWRGTYSKFDNGYDIFKLDKLFIELFPQVGTIKDIFTFGLKNK